MQVTLQVYIFRSKKLFYPFVQGLTGGKANLNVVPACHRGIGMHANTLGCTFKILPTAFCDVWVLLVQRREVAGCAFMELLYPACQNKSSQVCHRGLAYHAHFMC